MLKRIITALKCAIISVVTAIVCIFILAVVSYTTGISNQTLTACVYITAILSVFIGTFLSARVSDTKPLVSAVITGLIFYAVIAVLTLILKHGITLNTHFFAMTAGMMATSVLGAIIGK